MPFTEEDKHVIKFLRQNKNYGAKRLLKEFPNKGWTRGGLNSLILKIDQTGSFQRLPGSGLKRTARTVENVERVEALVQRSRVENYGTQRQISRELGISPSSLKRILRSLKSDLKKQTLTNGIEENYLYDPKLLNEIEWDEAEYKFEPEISPLFPGDNLVIRPLSCTDYDKGFPAILRQLTDLGTVNKEDFLKCFRKMKSCENTYYVTVIEDLSTSEVIGAATLLVEQKFIHSLALKGRIEDVVVCSLYRGKQLGKLLVATLIQLSKRVSCYKLSLDCKDRMIPFYSQLGFQLEEGNSNTMVIRF